MYVNTDYKQRLSQWVIDEQKQLKISERQFAAILGVSYHAVQKWRKQKIKKSLQLESLEAIARYRKCSVELIKNWLEGTKNEDTAKILEAIKTASPSVLVQIIKVAVERLEKIVDNSI